MNHSRIHLLGLFAIFIFSVIDIARENYHSYYTLLHAVLPVIITFLVAKYIKWGVYKGYILWVAAYLNLMLGIVAWVYYAFNGTSDPSTAAHMHVLLFPALHMGFGICLMVVAYLAELVSKYVLSKKAA